MPHSKFVWASVEELKLLNDFFNIRSDPERENVSWDAIWEADTGFFIEADLSFPQHIKKDLANFPPAPHRVQVTHAGLTEVNSVYGKFGENVVNQTNMDVVNNRADFNRLILDPYYKSHQIIGDDLVIVEKYKDAVELDRPVQLASCILELGKQH